MSTRDAAARLVLTPRQVQRLVARGSLHQPARGVLDARSVKRYAAQSSVPRRSPWAPETAALDLAASLDPRERRADLDTLQRLLDRHRDG